MKYKLLPHTNIKVSTICLGTMTFGRQNTEKDGHEQIDYALERGVNFIDTAECIQFLQKLQDMVIQRKL